jgi:hypothetical protein
MGNELDSDAFEAFKEHGKFDQKDASLIKVTY